MRSCAFLIFEAATISMALVIFRVFCTLLIFTLISLVPGIGQNRGQTTFFIGVRSQCNRTAREKRGLSPVLETSTFLPVLDGRLQRLLLVGGEVLLVFHGLDQRRVLVLQVVAHRFLGRQRLFDLDVVEVAVVHGEKRQRHFPYLKRLVLRLLHQLGHHSAALELLPC